MGDSFFNHDISDVSGKRLAATNYIYQTTYYETDTGLLYKIVLDGSGNRIWALIGQVSAVDINLYVNNQTGSDSNPGTSAEPLLTLAEALRRLPPAWSKAAAIHLAVTGVDYALAPDPISTEANLSYGRAVGPNASGLVIFGGYTDEVGTFTAQGGSTNDNIVTTLNLTLDQLIGASCKSTSGANNGKAVPIRGNSAGPGSTINLQASPGTINVADSFVVQRPSVTIAASAGATAFNVYGPGVPEEDLTLVGVKMVAPAGCFFRIVGARIQHDTCEWDSTAKTHFIFHGRLEGGLALLESPGLDPLRASAAMYLKGTSGSNNWTAALNGMIGGHITTNLIGIATQQGGQFLPLSLECLAAPVRIAGDGSSVAPTSQGWGSATNPGRIRNNSSQGGDGLFVAGTGRIIVGGQINLDVFGCTRDGVRVDTGGQLTCTAPGGGAAGLRTTGAANGGFGMNVRNGGKAFIGTDALTVTNPLAGAGSAAATQVALDSVAVPGGWADVLAGPQSNARLSLVAATD